MANLNEAYNQKIINENLVNDEIKKHTGYCSNCKSKNPTYARSNDGGRTYICQKCNTRFSMYKKR